MAGRAKKSARKTAAPVQNIAPAPRVAPGDVFRPKPRPAPAAPAAPAAAPEPRARRVPGRTEDTPGGIFRPRRQVHGPTCIYAAAVYFRGEDAPRWERRWLCDTVCGAPLYTPAPGAPERVERLEIDVGTGERWVSLGAISIRLSEWLRERENIAKQRAEP